MGNACAVAALLAHGADPVRAFYPEDVVPTHSEKFLAVQRLLTEAKKHDAAPVEKKRRKSLRVRCFRPFCVIA